MDPNSSSSHHRRWPLSAEMPPLGALPTAPRAARAYVRLTLAMWELGELSDQAEMIVSELVANGVNASESADGPYRDGRLLMVQVLLRASGSRVRAEVWDQAPGEPAPREASGDDESGRGLELVDALATNWGWHSARVPGPDPAAGHMDKCVWAEIAGKPDDQ
jgi:anti-sigma regulatory factor (Ser/Thr protein kinase)